jgi:hypothetical protein
MNGDVDLDADVNVCKIRDIVVNIVAVAVLPLWSFQPNIALLCDSQS